MIQEILNEIKTNLVELKLTPKSLRHFSWLLGIAWLIIYWFKAIIWSDFIFLFPTSVLFGVGLIYPQILKPFYWLWMFLTFILGAVISRFILIIMFFGAILPVRFLAQLFGVKFIDRSFKQTKASYWQARPTKKSLLEQPF